MVKFKFLAMALLMGAFAVSCDKDNSSKKGDEGGDDPAPTPTEQIDIDGNFAEWESESITAVATMPDGIKTNAALKTIKFASDESYVYCYCKFENHLKSLKGVDVNWDGNGSWNTEDGVTVPTPLRVALDCDANPKTGMIIGNCFPKIGAEIVLELYQYLRVETGQVTLAWSQCNILNVQREAEDGDDFNDGTPPQRWGNDGKGDRDNTLVLKSNYAAKVSGATVQVEFAIDRDAMEELPKGQKTINISVQYMGCDSGPTGGSSMFGYLPQSEEEDAAQYVTLNLK